jgi:hypothetical protein
MTTPIKPTSATAAVQVSRGGKASSAPPSTPLRGCAKGKARSGRRQRRGTEYSPGRAQRAGADSYISNDIIDDGATAGRASPSYPLGAGKRGDRVVNGIAGRRCCQVEVERPGHDHRKGRSGQRRLHLVCEITEQLQRATLPPLVLKKLAMPRD